VCFEGVVDVVVSSQVDEFLFYVWCFGFGYLCLPARVIVTIGPIGGYKLNVSPSHSVRLAVEPQA
jgi:hypothetical protein